MKVEHRIEVRVNEQLRDLIDSNAKALGLSVSAYVRMLLVKSLEVKGE